VLPSGVVIDFGERGRCDQQVRELDRSAWLHKDTLASLRVPSVRD
jgi:hypothetical protein